MEYSTIKTALVQTQIVWEDKERNYETAGRRIAEAAEQGAEAVFFPEMSFTGFSMNTDATKESDGWTVRHMGALARQHHVSIGFGWVKDCTGECGRCENHYTIVDAAGAVLSDYAKIHPFSYAGEDLKFRGGSTLTHFSLNGIPCSSLICYDLRFPEIFQAASKRAPGLYPCRQLRWRERRHPIYRGQLCHQSRRGGEGRAVWDGGHDRVGTDRRRGGVSRGISGKAGQERGFIRGIVFPQLCAGA